MGFRFEELRVWQLAVDLSNHIHQLVKSFPKEEVYCLAAQMKRAADSVVLNIAEGSTGQTKAEFKRFLTIALRSAIEVAAALYLAYSRKYFTRKNMKNFMPDITNFAGWSPGSGIHDERSNLPAFRLIFI